MRTLVAGHPLGSPERTDSPAFRQLADGLRSLLASEVTTPAARATGLRLARPLTAVCAGV